MTRSKKAHVQANTKVQKQDLLSITLPILCPKCGQAEMVVTQSMPPIRGSPIKIFHRPIPNDRIVKIRKTIA